MKTLVARRIVLVPVLLFATDPGHASVDGELTLENLKKDRSALSRRVPAIAAIRLDVGCGP